MNRNEKNILVLCGVGHFYSHFYMLLFPSLALWIRRDFNLSLPDTLNLGFAMYLLFGMAAFPMGVLADRWCGHRPLLIGMMIGMGISSLFCAVSQEPRWLMVGLAGIGFFASIYHPVGIGLISKCCRSLGQALGNNGVWGNLGIGLAPVLAGLSGYLFSWRTGFAVFGGTILVLGLAAMFVKIHEEPVPRSEGSKDSRAEPSGNLVYFLIMLGCMGLLGLCYRGTVVSVPGYFEENIRGLKDFFSWGQTVETASSHTFGTTVLVSGIYLFAILGQITGGRLADRLDLRAAYLIFHCSTLPFMILMGFLTELPLFVMGMGYLFFSLGMQPIENSLVARLTPNGLRSIAYGLKFVLVLGFGAFSVKLVRWIIQEQGDARMVYWVQAGFITLVIGGILALCWFSRGKSFRNA